MLHTFSYFSKLPCSENGHEPGKLRVPEALKQDTYQSISACYKLHWSPI